MIKKLETKFSRPLDPKEEAKILAGGCVLACNCGDGCGSNEKSTEKFEESEYNSIPL